MQYLGQEHVVCDPVGTVFYCWACQHEMLSKDKIDYECPVCHNHYSEKMAL